MKLLFKQKLFTWFPVYDVYDENGNVIFTVKRILTFRYNAKIYDKNGAEAGVIREKLTSLFRRHFEIEVFGMSIGCIIRELSIFIPRFTLELKDWKVTGNWLEWNYTISSPRGEVAAITKHPFTWGSNYEIEIKDPGDALAALMVVLVADATKYSRSR